MLSRLPDLLLLGTLAADLLFVRGLPALSSLVGALLAGCLAVGTLWFLNAGAARKAENEGDEEQDYAEPAHIEPEA